jgi:hypothetical protein
VTSQTDDAAKIAHRVPPLAHGNMPSQYEFMSSQPVCSRTPGSAEHFDFVLAGSRKFVEVAQRAIVEPTLSRSASSAIWPAPLARQRLTWKFAVSAWTASISRRARAALLAVGGGTETRVVGNRADMRFSSAEPADLILSECDAITHVPHRSDPQRVSLALARAPDPGGGFENY